MVVDETAVAPNLDAQASVDDVMRRWPATVGVFIRLRMTCVGCPFGVFHTLAQACEEHGLPIEAVLAALERSLAPGDPGGSFSAAPSGDAQ
jgi:hybrid cluster-associated redox disulfide protein